jgi:hypothetical protein
MNNDTIAITVAAFFFLVWAALYVWTSRTAPAASERDYIWATDPKHGAVPGDLARGRQ